MIIEMAGEDILFENESRLDEMFYIHLCEDALEIEKPVILKIEDFRGVEIGKDDYNFQRAITMVKAHLQAEKKWAAIQREAHRAGVDL